MDGWMDGYSTCLPWFEFYHRLVLGGFVVAVSVTVLTVLVLVIVIVIADMDMYVMDFFFLFFFRGGFGPGRLVY